MLHLLSMVVGHLNITDHLEIPFCSVEYAWKLERRWRAGIMYILLQLVGTDVIFILMAS